MKLYEISTQYQDIFNNVDESGEISEEQLDLIGELSDDFRDKAIAIASFIKNLEAEKEAIDNAIKGMSDRKSRLSGKISSMGDYLHNNMQLVGLTEITGSPYFKIRIKACPVSVEVMDESLLPSEYLRERVSVSVDKIKIKDDINAGFEIPGASLVRKLKLEIK